jgi:hypothetical protein
VSPATFPSIFDRSRVLPSALMLPAVLSVLALVAPARGENRGLFRIERSTNRNVVQYDIRLAHDGTPDSRDPVSAYWIMLAEDGHREGLTFFEQQLAYGLDVAKAPDGLTLHLKAIQKRPVHVRRRGQRWEAQTTIGGRAAALRRVWVQCDPGLLGPVVRFVDVTGTDLETGRPLAERIPSR